MAKNNYLSGGKSSVFKEEKKELKYLRAFQEKSHAEEIQELEKELEEKGNIFEISKQILEKGNEILANGGKLTKEFQEQYDAAQSVVDEYYKTLHQLNDITKKEQERIFAHEQLLKKNKEFRNDLESIGNLLGRNSKEYMNGVSALESMDGILSTVGRSIAGLSTDELKRAGVETAQSFKDANSEVLQFSASIANGSADAEDIINITKRGLASITKYASAFDDGTDAGREMKNSILAMSMQLKGQASDALKDVISNTYDLEKSISRVKNEFGETSDMFKVSSNYLDDTKVNLQAISSVIAGIDDERLQKVGINAADGWKKFQAQKIEADVSFKRGDIDVSEYNKLIENASSEFIKLADGIDDSTEAGKKLKAVFGGITGEIKAEKDAAKATNENLAAMDNALNQIGSSGIPLMNELSGVFQNLIKGGNGLKLSLMALGAALGALAAKTIFAPMQVGIEMTNRQIQNSIDLLRELGKNEVKFSQPVIQTQANIDVGQQYIEAAKKRKDSEVEIASIRRRLDNEISKSQIANREEVLKLENDAANAAAKSAISFNSQLQQGAAQFRAAAKTALFGESLGPVKYLASQLQLAGVSAEEIASSMGEVSRTMGQIPSSEVASDMAVFSKRIGASASEISDIANAMNLIDGYSLDTSLNMQAGLKAMAKQAKLNLGNLVKGMAVASKNMLSYQIKSSSELARQVAYAQSIGVDFDKVAGAGRNMVLNYKDSIKGEMKLSAMLGRSVDLSEVRQKFYEGKTDEAIEALKAQGLDPTKMDMFAQDQLAQTTGMDLETLKSVFERTGKETGPLKSGDITKENKEYLGKKQAAEATLAAQSATISAKTAILESKFSQKVLEKFLTDKDGKLAKIRTDNFNLEKRTADMEADIAAGKIKAIANDTSLQDMMKHNSDLNAELNNLVGNLETQNQKIRDAEAQQKGFDVRKSITENIIPLVLSLVGSMLMPKIGEMIMGGKGGGGIMSMFTGGGGGGIFSKLLGSGEAGGSQFAGGSFSAGKKLLESGATKGSGIGGMMKGISPAALSNVAMGLSGVIGAFEGYKNFDSVRKGEKETRTTDKLGAGFVQGGLAVAGTALGAAFGGPIGAMIGGFLGNTLGGWINKNAPGIARMYGSMFEGIKSSFAEIGKVWDSTKEKFGQLFEKLEPIITPVKEAFNSIAGALGFEGEGVGGVLKAVTKFVWDVFLTPFRALFSALGLVADLVGVVVKLFKGDWAGAWTDFKKSIGDFFAGIFAPFDNVIYAIKKAWAGVYNWVADSWLGRKLGMDAIDTTIMEREHQAKLDAEKAAEAAKKKKKDEEAAAEAAKNNMGVTSIQYGSYAPQTPYTIQTPAQTPKPAAANKNTALLDNVSTPPIEATHSISKETEGAIQRSAGYLQQIVTRTENTAAILNTLQSQIANNNLALLNATNLIQSQADKRGIVTLNAINLIQSQADKRGIIMAQKEDAQISLLNKIQSEANSRGILQYQQADLAKKENVGMLNKIFKLLSYAFPDASKALYEEATKKGMSKVLDYYSASPSLSVTLAKDKSGHFDNIEKGVTDLSTDITPAVPTRKEIYEGKVSGLSTDIAPAVPTNNEMKLSTTLGRSVDLSEARAKFVEGDQAGALKALKAQGLNPKDMDLFQQQALQDATGGVDLGSLQKIQNTLSSSIDDSMLERNNQLISPLIQSEESISNKPQKSLLGSSTSQVIRRTIRATQRGVGAALKNYGNRNILNVTSNSTVQALNQISSILEKTLSTQVEKLDMIISLMSGKNIDNKTITKGYTTNGKGSTSVTTGKKSTNVTTPPKASTTVTTPTPKSTTKVETKDITAKKNQDNYISQEKAQKYNVTHLDAPPASQSLSDSKKLEEIKDLKEKAFRDKIKNIESLSSETKNGVPGSNNTVNKSVISSITGTTYKNAGLAAAAYGAPGALSDESAIKFLAGKGLEYWKGDGTVHPIKTFAKGTDNAPGSMAMVGELGPELMIPHEQKLGSRALANAFAKGTDNAPGSMAMVGEKGPELMYVPNKASIVPNDDTLKVQSGDTSVLSKWGITGFADGKVGTYQPIIDSTSDVLKTVKLKLDKAPKLLINGPALYDEFEKYLETISLDWITKARTGGGGNLFAFNIFDNLFNSFKEKLSDIGFSGKLAIKSYKNKIKDAKTKGMPDLFVMFENLLNTPNFVSNQPDNIKYYKNIQAFSEQGLSWLDETKPKLINNIINTILHAGGVQGYAKGTDNAPGGISMVGEAGPELLIPHEQKLGSRALANAFAKGTDNAPGGLSLVGERGPELMHVPDSASIVPNGDTRKVQSGDVSLLSKWGITGYEDGKKGKKSNERGISDIIYDTSDIINEYMPARSTSAMSKKALGMHYGHTESQKFKGAETAGSEVAETVKLLKEGKHIHDFAKIKNLRGTLSELMNFLRTPGVGSKVAAGALEDITGGFLAPALALIDLIKTIYDVATLPALNQDANGKQLPTERLVENGIHLFGASSADTVSGMTFGLTNYLTDWAGLTLEGMAASDTAKGRIAYFNQNRDKNQSYVSNDVLVPWIVKHEKTLSNLGISDVVHVFEEYNKKKIEEHKKNIEREKVLSVSQQKSQKYNVTHLDAPVASQSLSSTKKINEINDAKQIALTNKIKNIESLSAKSKADDISEFVRITGQNQLAYKPDWRTRLPKTQQPINKSPFGNIPGFAKGTKNSPKGPAIVGEKGPEIVGQNGPEIVNLKSGSTVIPNNILKNLPESTAVFNPLLPLLNDSTVKRNNISDSALKNQPGIKKDIVSQFDWKYDSLKYLSSPSWKGVTKNLLKYTGYKDTRQLTESRAEEAVAGKFTDATMAGKKGFKIFKEGKHFIQVAKGLYKEGKLASTIVEEIKLLKNAKQWGSIIKGVGKGIASDATLGITDAASGGVMDLLGPIYAVGMTLWNAGKSFTDNSAYDLNGNLLSNGKMLGNAGQNFGGRSFDLLDDITLGAFSGEGLIGKIGTGIQNLQGSAIDKLGLSPETSGHLKGLMTFMTNPLAVLSNGIKDSGLLLPGLNGADTAKLRNAYFNNNPDKNQGFVDNNTLIKWALEHKYELANNDKFHGGFDDAQTILKIVEDEDFKVWKQVHPKEPVGNYSNNWRKNENYIPKENGPNIIDDVAYLGKTALNTVKTAASDVWSGVKSKGSAIWDKTKNVASKAWTGIKSFGSAAWDKTKNVASNVWSGVKGVGSAAWDKTKTAASNVWSGAKNVGSAALNKTKELASNAWNTVTSWFSEGTDNAPGGPSVVGELGPEVVIPNAYANGTNSAIGGMSLVGERGPEIVNLPKGAQVIPNNKLPDTLSSFANGTPNIERLINQIQSEAIANGIPVQARLSDMVASNNANQVLNSSNIRTNASEALHSEALMSSMNANTKLLNELNTNLKSYLQNNNQPQNINLMVDGRVLNNIQYRREQNRKGMKPNDLV